MPTFQRCDSSIDELAAQLIKQFESHTPLAAAKAKIDYVFAYADTDEEGRKLNDALTKNGVRAIGLTRKIPLKDRALGRGDAEISIDGDWWNGATAEQQAALLDHELHHVSIKSDKSGNIQFDDLGRPQIKLRKHDVEIGWFKVIAERHGAASLERIQAKSIMDNDGQYFWPDLAPTIEISTGDRTVKMSQGAFAKAASKMVGA